MSDDPEFVKPFLQLLVIVLLVSLIALIIIAVINLTELIVSDSLTVFMLLIV